MKFYGYKKCGTCRTAMKWLDDRGVKYSFIDITEHPPAAAALNQALRSGYEIKHLFNTSGQHYRELGLKNKVGSFTQKQAVELLSMNGYLCKRPLVINANRVTVGFKEDVFAEVWG